MAYSDNFVADLLSLVTDLVSAEKMEMSEMLYSKAFTHSEITEKEEVVTGVRHGNVVPILKDTPNPESFPFVDETDCAPTDCDITHEFGDHQWELGLIECRVGICLRSFDENFLKFFNAWRMTQQGDVDVDSAILAFISEKFNKNLNLSTFRAAYFADKSSLSVYFNKIDGIFTRMEAGAADQLVEITENDGANYAAQAMGGEDAYNYLIAMYDKASLQPWFDDSIMEYRVTRWMGALLVSWLNKLGKKAPMNCDCIDPKAAVAKNVYTLAGLRINGIPVVVYNEWDDIINYSTELPLAQGIVFG